MKATLGLALVAALGLATSASAQSSGNATAAQATAQAQPAGQGPAFVTERGRHRDNYQAGRAGQGRGQRGRRGGNGPGDGNRQPGHGPPGRHGLWAGSGVTATHRPQRPAPRPPALSGETRSTPGGQAAARTLLGSTPVEEP